MNQISVKQNQGKYLKYLAAQRQLYDEAKKWYGGALGAGILIAIIGNAFFLTRTWDFVPPLISLLAVAIALIDSFALPHIADKRRKDAAKIQEAFDCDVLEIPWNQYLGARPAAEAIYQAAERYKSKHSSQEWESLRNWYTPAGLEEMDLPQARVACQRENIWWDSELRRKYASWVTIVTIVLFVVLIVWGVVSNWSLRDLLGPFSFSISLLIIGCKHREAHLKAAERLDKLRGLADALWRNVQEHTLTDDETVRQSRELQTQIFQHRSSTVPVFSWFYNRLRKQFENTVKNSDL